MALPGFNCSAQHLDRIDRIPYRVLALLGGLIYPAFHFVYSVTAPGVVDPLGERLVIGGAFLGAAAWFTIKKDSSRRLQRRVLGWIGIAMAVNLLSIVLRNHLHPAYAVGTFITISILSAIFISQCFYFLLIGTVTAMSTPLFFMETLQPKGSFVFGLFIILLVNYLALQSRLKLSTELSQKEERYRFLSDSTFEGLMAVRDGEVVETNRALRAMFRLDDPADDPIPASNFFSGSQEGALHRLLDKGMPGAIRLEGVRVDGTRFAAECMSRKFRYEDRETTVVAVRDISEREKAEVLVREQQKQLAAHSKWVSLGEMAGGVAHEINNPLAIIYFSTERMIDALNREQIANPKIHGYAVKILNTVERIARITRGLLSFARGSQEQETELASLGELIDMTLPLCDERFKNAGVDLQVSGVDHTTLLKCRPTEISQVLVNLLNNAFDAVHAHEGERWVRVRTEQDEERVRILIEDSGPGITREARERIMDPFFTTKPVGKGTGIGLSISRGIAESHGGTLSLLPVRKPTTFELCLPYIQAGEERAA